MNIPKDILEQYDIINIEFPDAKTFDFNHELYENSNETVMYLKSSEERLRNFIYKYRAAVAKESYGQDVITYKGDNLISNFNKITCDISGVQSAFAIVSNVITHSAGIPCGYYYK